MVSCLWDPTGGLRDLQQGCLTAVSEANLIDDPLRLLRGLRLMAEIPLTISSQTMAWIERHVARLPEAAPERILAELQRLVRGHRERLVARTIDLDEGDSHCLRLCSASLDILGFGSHMNWRW